MFRSKPIVLGASLLAFVSLIIIGLFLLGGDGRSLESSSLPERPRVSGLPQAFDQRLSEVELRVRRSDDDFDSWFELGRLYHGNGFNQRADSCYAAALSASPNEIQTAKAFYYRADIALASGNIDDARQLLSTALRLEPSYVPARILLGDLAFKTGELDDAAEQYRAALEWDADNPFALLGLARERMQRGGDDEALPLLERLAETHPDFNRGISLLARVMERLGLESEARVVRANNRSRWDLSPSDPWMEEIRLLSYDPQRLSIYFEDYKRVGQIEKAMEILDRILHLDPSSSTAYEMKGVAYAELQRFEEARRAFEQSLRLNGDPATVYPQLIKALVQLDLRSEAGQAADKALAAAPTSTEVLVEVAGVRMAQNRIQEAADLLESSVAIDPFHALSHRILSHIYRRTGRVERSLESLEILRQLVQDDLYARVAIGAHYLDANQPGLAVEPLQEAHRIDGDDDDIAEMLAVAHSKLAEEAYARREFTLALACYDAAIEANPDFTDPRASKIQLLLGLQEFAKAEVELLELIELMPNRPELYLSLGDVRFAVGRVEEAASSWKEALAMPSAKGRGDLKQDVETRLQSIP